MPVGTPARSALSKVDPITVRWDNPDEARRRQPALTIGARIRPRVPNVDAKTTPDRGIGQTLSHAHAARDDPGSAALPADATTAAGTSPTDPGIGVATTSDAGETL